jgi:hypothetical protein
LSGLFLVLILAHAAQKKAIFMAPKYILLFFIFCLHLLAGAILNGVDPGTVFAGIRYYFKYTPLFMLPAVYHFSDDEFQWQLKLLLTLLLIQFPLTIYQKFFTGWDMADLVSGTLGVSPVLSLVLVSAVLIVLGFYIKQKITLGQCAVLSFFLFLPATINETKATLIFLPVGVAVVIYASRLWHENKAKVVGISTIGAMLLVGFIGIYDTFFTDVSGEEGLLSFFSESRPGGVESYLYTGDAAQVDTESLLKEGERFVGEATTDSLRIHDIRRIDGLILPFRVLSNRPSQLLLGLGIGNVRESFISRFSGRYEKIRAITKTNTLMGDTLWEIGLVGLVIYLVFVLFIFADSLKLAASDGLAGRFAIGWSAAVLLFLVSFPYVNFLTFNAIGYLFFFYSGLIATSRYRET